jgi:hypothetical protein
MCKNPIKTISYLLASVAIATSAVSCSTKDSPADTDPEMEGTYLKVNIAGVTEYATTNITPNSQKMASVKDPNSSFKVATLVGYEDFDVLTTVEAQEAPSESSDITSTGKIASSSKLAVTQPMKTGMAYRLIIQKAGTAIYNKVIKSGTSPLIPNLDGGTNYTWHAFSVNDAAIVPATDNNSTTTSYTAAELANKDVLYANGNFTAVAGPNYLNITFAHQTVRYDIELNTRGIFGPIATTGSPTVSLTNAANTNIIQSMGFNMITGAATGTATNVSAVPITTFTNVVGHPSNTVKAYTFYTVNKAPIAANGLKVVWNTMRVTLHDENVRNFGTTTLTVPTPAMTPASGNKYTITNRVIEAGVQVGTSKWARTNLFYKGATNGEDNYLFQATRYVNFPAAQQLNDYWKWGTSLPNGTFNSSTIVDPCTKVYPENTWRLPTAAEYAAADKPNGTADVLFGNSNYYKQAGLLTLLLGGDYDMGYIWNTPTTSNSAYPEKKLVMPFLGYIQSGTTITGLPTGSLLSLVSSGTLAYWTKDSGDAANTAKAYKSTLNSVSILDILTLARNQIFKTEDHNLDHRLNVRCIRAN